MGLRRKGREIAMQVLYSREFDKNSIIKDQIENIADNSKIKDKKIIQFSMDILNLVLTNLEFIDEKIKLYSQKWPFERIAIPDKSILRIATAEMYFSTVAHPVIMDEAIEIAKKYCSESTGRFINGILNTISKEIESNETNKM